MSRTIPARGWLDVEFNTDGRELSLGVEEDRQVTGVHAAHDDPAGLAALARREQLVRPGEKSAARYGRYPKILGAPGQVLGDGPNPPKSGRREP